MMGCSPGDNECKNDEKPPRQVEITNSFEMGKFEVTQTQWQTLMGGNPSTFKGANLPVETVSWEQVQTFLARLNDRNDGFQYRLPTEEEWEYAARAGSPGATFGPLDQIAWYGNNSGRAELDTRQIWTTDRASYEKRMEDNGNQTHPVGQKRSNAWGLHDMLGNVLELVQDSASSGTHFTRGGWFASSDLNSDSSVRVSARVRVFNRGVSNGGDSNDGPPKKIPAQTAEAAAKLKAGGGAAVFVGQKHVGFRVVREAASAGFESSVAQNASRASETEPVSLGLLIDVSGSMKDKLFAVREAAVTLLRAGSTADEYFVESFSDRPTIEQDFTSDRGKLRTALISLSAGGKTAMRDAVYLGLEKVQLGANARKGLLLIIGGDDNQSRYTFENLRDFSRRQNVRFFAIGLGMSTQGRSELQELTGMHGGSAFFPDSPNEIRDLCVRIRTDLLQ
jgi:formylglycine-generating enzyme required for sulfatase activity